MTKPVVIEVGHRYSKFLTTYPKKVEEVTSFEVQGAKFSEIYQRGLWDGRRKLLTKTHTFPTGLLHIVTDAILLLGYECEIKESVTYPPIASTEIKLEGITLRDYQEEAIQAGIKEKRGIFCMGTSSGKTECMIGITQFLGLNTLVLTHRKELLYQTRERFATRLGVDLENIGIIGDGHFEPQPITIGMIQTLWGKKKVPSIAEVLRATKVIHIDECHHVADNDFYKLVMSCEAPYRFGYSGTPLMREDGSSLMLIGATGPIIYELKSSHMVKEGFSAAPLVFFDKVESEDTRMPFGVSYQAVYDKYVVKNNIRNQMIINRTEELSKRDLPVIIFVKSINHGRILKRSLDKERIPNVYIHGSHTGEYRTGVIKRFVAGEFNVLISSVILEEGVDMPGSIAAIIVASAGKSSIATLQRLGRGMRKNPYGKVLIYDYWDTSHQYLERHSKQRMKDYKLDPSFVVEKPAKEPHPIPEMRRLDEKT